MTIRYEGHDEEEIRGRRGDCHDGHKTDGGAIEVKEEKSA